MDLRAIVKYSVFVISECVKVSAIGFILVVMFMFEILQRYGLRIQITTYDY